MNAAILLQQTADPLLTLLSSYGWLGIIAWLFFDRILPFLKEQFSASHKLRLAREEEDRHIRAVREEKLTTVLEQFASQLQTFGLAMTATAERLASIERDQDAMREALAILADRKQRAQRGGKVGTVDS